MPDVSADPVPETEVCQGVIVWDWVMDEEGGVGRERAGGKESLSLCSL